MVSNQQLEARIEDMQHQNEKMQYLKHVAIGIIGGGNRIFEGDDQITLVKYTGDSPSLKCSC